MISLGYTDGSGYEARFSRCGICTLMKERGISEIVPAICHLDYAMSEAGGRDRFYAAVHAGVRRSVLRLRI